MIWKIKDPLGISESPCPEKSIKTSQDKTQNAPVSLEVKAWIMPPGKQQWSPKELEKEKTWSGN